MEAKRRELLPGPPAPAKRGSLLAHPLLPTAFRTNQASSLPSRPNFRTGHWNAKSCNNSGSRNWILEATSVPPTDTTRFPKIGPSARANRLELVTWGGLSASGYGTNPPACHSLTRGTKGEWAPPRVFANGVCRLPPPFFLKRPVRAESPPDHRSSLRPILPVYPTQPLPGGNSGNTSTRARPPPLF